MPQFWQLIHSASFASSSATSSLLIVPSQPAVLADVFVSALILILVTGQELGAALVARIHIVLVLAIFVVAHTVGHYLIEYLLANTALVCK